MHIYNLVHAVLVPGKQAWNRIKTYKNTNTMNIVAKLLDVS